MEWLLEILRQGVDQQMLFIRYEDIAPTPATGRSAFTPTWGLPSYEGHDFNNMEQITDEDSEV